MEPDERNALNLQILSALKKLKKNKWIRINSGFSEEALAQYIEAEILQIQLKDLISFLKNI